MRLLVPDFPTAQPSDVNPRFLDPDSPVCHRKPAAVPMIPLRIAFLWAMMNLLVRTSAAADPDDPATEQASFKVLDGFDVQLFASERDGAVKPVAIRFDARGRLWVVGSTVYPQLRPGEVANDKVTILEDTDHDGRADRTTVFADGFLIPLGLELGDQGAYVSSATELIHVRDRDGDGRADERRIVLRGFGTGDAHQTINSFTWGPSGELMISQGLHAQSRVETPWGLAELRQAGLFRLWPRSLKLDPIWSGAMGAHNPFGTVFDRWGQPFVFAGNGHGIYHLTPALVPTDHFLLHPSLWQQGRKFGGADIVENSHWPDSHQGECITGGYLQNTVERFRFSDAGSTFRIERLPPLIESTNTAFRIIDARFGPDGALYLCDWYNTLIGHYQTSLRDPGRDRSRGRIWRVTARGRPLVAWKSLESLPIPDLLNQLTSSERWNRQLAKRVLADRPTDAVTRALDSWCRTLPDSNALPLFEALGVYASHNVQDTHLLGRLAVSQEPGARAYAARVIGHWAPKLSQPLERLTPLVNDPHPRVRLEAVVACAHVRDPRAVEVAALATDQAMDSHLEYAFTQTVHALKGVWRDFQSRGLLTFGGNSQRATAFARADGSGDTVSEAAARLARVGEVALDRDTVERLARLVVRSGGPKELPVLLRSRTFTVGDTYHTDLQAQILEALWQRLEEQPVLPAGNIAASLIPFLNHSDLRLRQGAIRLAGAWQVDALRDPIATMAADTQQPTSSRTAAIAALGGYAKQDDRRVLEALSAAPTATELRAEAIQALARFALPTAAAAAGRWLSDPSTESKSTTTLSRIVSAFLTRKEGLAVLARTFQEQPPLPARAESILALLAASGRHHPELNQALQHAAQIQTPVPLTIADIPALAESVRRTGRPEMGQGIFERASLACVTCHAIDGTPGRIGPDLGALGSAQSIEYILGAILDPQKEVKEGFVAHEIETRDGEIHQGYPRGEHQGFLEFQDHLAQRIIRLETQQIVSRRMIGSLMPPGLANALSREELRDLVAYLSRLGRRD